MYRAATNLLGSTETSYRFGQMSEVPTFAHMTPISVIDRFAH